MKHALMSLIPFLLSIAASSATSAAPGAADATMGRQVFERWCADCHGTGPRLPGTASLAVKYGGAVPAALEARGDMAPELIRYFVRNGVLIMPPFRKTEITDAELDALTQYLSQSKGQR